MVGWLGECGAAVIYRQFGGGYIVLYCPLPDLDGGAIGKELRHAIEGGPLQIRREEDDANVIYK